MSILSIENEIDRIKTNIQNAYTKCAEKGATLPEILNSENLAICIASIINDEEIILPAGEYIDGAAALWTAIDELNSENQWVDRINNYTFTPMNSTIIPSYNSELKLLDFNEYGGMISSLSLPATSETPYTLELVVRDMDESSSSGDSWGKLLGPEMSNWYNKDYSYAINGAWNHPTLPEGQKNTYSIDYYVNSKQTTYRSISERAHGLTTITVIPTQGLWINGVKEAEFNLSCITTQFALASGIGNNASYSKTKFKVHGVRYYPIELTTEQIVHNYEVDKSIFDKGSEN